eukprot:5286839-Amphidinium_carterae.1
MDGMPTQSQRLRDWSLGLRNRSNDSCIPVDGTASNDAEAHKLHTLGMCATGNDSDESGIHPANA